jgi:hypothetical protein
VLQSRSAAHVTTVRLMGAPLTPAPSRLPSPGPADAGRDHLKARRLSGPDGLDCLFIQDLADDLARALAVVQPGIPEGPVPRVVDLPLGDQFLDLA